MKKSYLFSCILSSLLIVSACNNSTAPTTTLENDSLGIASKNSLSQEKIQEPNSNENSEEIDNNNEEEILNFADSSITNYQDYYLKYIPYIEDGGGKLTVLNKKTGKILNFGDVVNGFQFYNDYIIYGTPTTGNMNNFEIAKLSTGAIVFGTECTESSYANGEVNFKAPVNDTLVSKKPICNKNLQKTPDNIGYVESQKFNLKTLKLIQTGKFECYYSE